MASVHPGLRSRGALARAPFTLGGSLVLLAAALGALQALGALLPAAEPSPAPPPAIAVEVRAVAPSEARAARREPEKPRARRPARVAIARPSRPAAPSKALTVPIAPPTAAPAAAVSAEAPPRAAAAPEASVSPSAAPAAAEGALGLGSGSQGARLLAGTLPPLPDELREEAGTTLAVARFAVAADGGATVSLTRPTADPRLNAYLLEALSAWRFAPAVVDGAPVASTFEVRIPIAVR